jgi:hypothetical protein
LLRVLILIIFSIFYKNINLLFEYLFIEFTIIVFLKIFFKNVIILEFYKNIDYIISFFLIFAFLMHIHRLNIYPESISKAGNEYRFFQTSLDLSENNMFSKETFLLVLSSLDDFLFYFIISLYYKFFNSKEFLTIIFFNLITASFTLKILQKIFKVKFGYKIVFFLSSIILFYSIVGLRDIFGVFLNSILFYLLTQEKKSINIFYYLKIIILSILIFFVRPLNIILIITFIFLLNYFKNIKFLKISHIIYFLIFLLFLFYSTSNLNFKFGSIGFNYQNLNEKMLEESTHGILAKMRINIFLFVIPLIVSMFGMSPIVLIDFKNYLTFDKFLITFSSLHTLYVIIKLIFHLYINNLKSYKLNFIYSYLIISSIIFFLNDELRHKLFYLLILYFTLLFKKNDE